MVVAAVLAGFWRQFAADPDPRILVLTALPGLERFPSISPDASWDGRWALVSATDVWESDIMVVDGVRSREV